MAVAQLTKNPYESLFIVPPETGQDKIDAFINKIKATLSKEEGTLKGVQVWGRRRLSYPIGRHKEGLYIYVDFDGGIKSATALDTLFRLSDIVVRFITVQKEDPPPVEPRKPKPTKEASPAAAGAAPAAPATTKESPSK